MELKVEHYPDKCCFIATLEGHEGCLSYVNNGSVINFTSTRVPDPIEGRGVAAAMVKAGLDYAREKEFKVKASCSYVVVYIRRHPEYSDLTA